MRSCVRCPDRACAYLTFSYAMRQVWMHDLTEEAAAVPGYPMCERHAGATTPPVGWVLHDRRSAVRPLFTELELGAFAEPELGTASVV